MVDDRRGTILQAVVEQYIKTSQPVSSSHVSAVSAILASSATIRSEMAALEREGYLQQPHTSAGRIPTDLGYRYFVDNLGTAKTLGPSQQHDVRQFFAKASGEIEQMLHETGVLLSTLTGATAVVVGPDRETATVRSVQLVSLGPLIILAVVVFSNGAIDKATIELEASISDAVIAAASTRLNTQLGGSSLSAPVALVPSGNVAVDSLVASVLLQLTGPDQQDVEHVYVGGTARIAESFEAVDTVRQVLTILEQQYVVVSLIRDLLDRGVNVSIGTENHLQSLAQCTLIVAPTIIDGEQRGSVAIIGPTRMNYGQAMAAVSLVSGKLGERLSEEAN